MKPNYYGYIEQFDPTNPKFQTYKAQLDTLGFDDTELWNFDDTIIKFIYPRLKRFIETYPKYNNTDTPEYEKMLIALKGIEIYHSNLETNISNEQTWDEIKKGLQALAEVLPHLWT